MAGDGSRKIHGTAIEGKRETRMDRYSRNHNLGIDVRGRRNATVKPRLNYGASGLK
jgi:hypothetical protein